MKAVNEYLPPEVVPIWRAITGTWKIVTILWATASIASLIGRTTPIEFVDYPLVIMQKYHAFSTGIRIALFDWWTLLLWDYQLPQLGMDLVFIWALSMSMLYNSFMARSHFHRDYGIPRTQEFGELREPSDKVYYATERRKNLVEVILLSPIAPFVLIQYVVQNWIVAVTVENSKKLREKIEVANGPDAHPKDVDYLVTLNQIRSGLSILNVFAVWFATVVFLVWNSMLI